MKPDKLMADITRTCIICRNSKTLENFYKDASKPLGFAYRCKKCDNAYTILRVKTKRKFIPHFKAIMRVHSKNWRSRNPEKVMAHGIVGRAIKSGTLVKPKSCEGCGSEKKLYGHHKDYDKPLSVNWLCTACHEREHHYVKAH